MVSKLSEVSIDCADPDALARFWCAVLDYAIIEDESPEEGVVGIAPGGADEPDGRPTLVFAQVSEGKVVKNRVHLDVRPTDRDQDAEVRRLLDLGARPADVGQTGEESWVTLADPEGNEFCVLATRRP
jgi:hypothetical protein